MSALLDNQVAIITGGGGAIGTGMGRVFAENGAAVALADVRTDNAEKVAQAIRDNGGKAIAVQCDVSSRESVNSMVQQVAETFGGVDILVNNAAIYPARPWMDITEEEWDRVFAINIKGYYLCAQACYPHFRARGKGKILNISSITFLLGKWANLLDYVTTKGAVVGFTRALAREVGTDNICVNCVAPGAIPTDAERIHRDPEGYNAMVLENQAIKRRGTPEDIAHAAMFFVSAHSDFVTGQTLLVDGGWGTH